MNNDEEYQHYDLQIRPIDPYGNAKYSILLTKIKGLSNLKILNIGSGRGELSILLAQQGHCVISLEPSLECVTYARKIAAERNLPMCEFIQMTVENYVTTETYDLVVSTDVVEHIKQDNQILLKMASLTKPNGLIFITVPALPWLSGNHDKKLHHFRRYTKQSLKKIIPGFLSIEMLRYFGFSLIPVAIIYSKILKRYYPISTNSPIVKYSLLKKILETVLKMDSAVPMPIGTSLVLLCKRKIDAV